MASNIDLRSELGPIRNQGPFRGTCLAFAVTAAHEHHRSDFSPLSVEMLYWGAKRMDGDTKSGTTIRSADQALRRWGQPAEDLWAYDTVRDDQHADYQPSAIAIDPAACHLGSLDLHSIDVATITGLLENRTVTVIGIPTWRGLSRPIKGRLTNPSPADLDGFHHALVIVGYRSDTNELLLRNSWGTSWGENGYAWISFNFLTDHVNTAWSVSSSIQVGLDTDREPLTLF